MEGNAPSRSFPRYTTPDVISSVTTWPYKVLEYFFSFHCLRHFVLLCDFAGVLVTERTCASFKSLIGIPIVLVNLPILADCVRG